MSLMIKSEKGCTKQQCEECVAMNCGKTIYIGMLNDVFVAIDATVLPRSIPSLSRIDLRSHLALQIFASETLRLHRARRIKNCNDNRSILAHNETLRKSAQ